MNQHQGRGSLWIEVQSLWPRLIRLGAALFCAFWAGSVMAQTSLENVSIVNRSGMQILKIDFNAPLKALPKVYLIQSPARLTLDFPDVVSGVVDSNVELQQGNFASAGIYQGQDKTRVVVNLKESLPHNVEIQGRSLVVYFEKTVSNASPEGVLKLGGNQQGMVEPLKDIDFRRGKGDSGRIIVSLANAQVVADIRQQGKNLVVDLLKSSLPQGLRRKMDVSDFGTPVQTVTNTEVGDKVRMVIEPRGAWEHSAYQSDQQLVIEVRPLNVDQGKTAQSAGYTGEKLSLNFQNIEVRALLQVIADFTNFNVVTSEAVNGALTLRLKDVPWDQALDIILQAKGLGMRKVGNVLWVAPKEEIAEKEKQEFEALAALQNLEPLKTQAFQLNYTKAAEIALQINPATGGQSNSPKILSTRGSLIAEPRTNQLFVTDVASRLEQIQTLISKLDVSVRQVLIEARIVEASDTFGKSLGVKLGGSDMRAQLGGDGGYSIGGNNRIAFGTTYSNAVSSSGAGGSLNTSGTFVNLPATGSGVADSAATFALSIFNPTANRFLNLELSAMESEGKGKVISSPRVVTADQTKALIEQGVEFPYQLATSSGATSVAFRKANLKLEVTPQITPEGNIILDVDVNNDSPGSLTPSGYAINTKHVKTQVLVENGGTVVIGGIFYIKEDADEARVPILGDVPVLGNLFKRRDKTVRKEEMLIFITPRTITDKAAGR